MSKVMDYSLLGGIKINPNSKYSEKKLAIKNLKGWSEYAVKRGIIKHTFDISLEELQKQTDSFFKFLVNRFPRFSNTLAKTGAWVEEKFGEFGVFVLFFPMLIITFGSFPFLYLYKLPHAWSSIEVAKKITKGVKK